jgi:hypothetical protein
MMHAPIIRQHNTDTDFFRVWTCIVGLTMDFEIDEPQHVILSGHLDVHHRGIVQGVIGYAGALSIVAVNPGGDFPPFPTSATPMGERFSGSTNGGNILNETDHYGKIAWNGARLLQPGKYRVLAHANSHSSLAPNTDGLAEVLVEGGAGLNCLIATFHPI